MTGKGDNWSVTARDIIGSVVTTGDNNTTTTTITVTLPPADKVDLAAELAALKQALAALRTPEQGKIERALADAQDEAKKPAPDKEEIGGALERAVKYAKGAEDFGAQAEKLAPRIAALASWLGDKGQKLLALAGLSI
jgi:hypothetical protein